MLIFLSKIHHSNSVTAKYQKEGQLDVTIHQRYVY